MDGSPEVASRCAICERPILARKKEAGRPPKFCSAACRRAREFEIRRVQGRLTRLEDEAERVRRNSLFGTAQTAEQISAEIVRNRDRLLILLD